MKLKFDEMKLKESLVYDKNENQVIGFVDLGELNNDLVRLEQSEGDQHPPVATHNYVSPNGTWNLHQPSISICMLNSPLLTQMQIFCSQLSGKLLRDWNSSGSRLWWLLETEQPQIFPNALLEQNTLCYKTKNPYIDSRN